VVDASIIEAPLSMENRLGEWDLDALLPLPADPYDAWDKQASRRVSL
jgi:hypothetical protein